MARAARHSGGCGAAPRERGREIRARVVQNRRRRHPAAATSDRMTTEHAGVPAHAEIRESVRRLCERFPGPYWRELDAARRYPTEFVAALTEAGYLAALIPAEYGGSGLP